MFTERSLNVHWMFTELILRIDFTCSVLFADRKDVAGKFTECYTITRSTTSRPYENLRLANKIATVIMRTSSINITISRYDM